MSTAAGRLDDLSADFRRTPTAGILRNELSKTLRLAWISRTGMYFEIPLFAAAFFLMLVFIGRGTVPPQLVAPTLIGMVAVIVLHQQINRTFWGVLGELQAGTFERLYLSPVPPPVLMIARQTSTAIQAVTVAAILILLTIVPSALAWDLGLALDLSAIQVVVPALAAIVGGAGVSLAVAGLTLLLRRLELLIEMIFAAATVLGGVLVPLHELSGPLEIAGRALLPIAQPIAYARRILIDGQTLATAQVDWGLAWLLGQPLLLLTLGAVIYGLAERTAQRRGILAG